MNEPSLFHLYADEARVRLARSIEGVEGKYAALTGHLDQTLAFRAAFVAVVLEPPPARGLCSAPTDTLPAAPSANLPAEGTDHE
jgi:hypothetical protein